MATTECKPFNEATITIPFPTGSQPIGGFSLDCGGSLIKLTSIIGQSKDSVTLHFQSFGATRLTEVLTHIKSTVLEDDSCQKCTVGVTLGHGTIEGHAGTIKDTLGVTITQVDEFTSFAKGLHYCLKNLPRESFIKKDLRPDDDTKDDKFPALLAMVGSAVGYILVDEDGSHRNVNGTVSGGLFCYSVGKLLTGAKTFEEFAEMARRGKSTSVSVMTSELFKDSYGDVNWDELHKKIPFDLEAFPFGKIIRNGLDINTLNKDDIARAWLHSVSGQVLGTSLATARKHCGDNRVVYYAGSFAENDIFQEFHDRMPHAIFYDDRVVYPCFLENGAYLGSLGGLLVGLEAARSDGSEQ